MDTGTSKVPEEGGCSPSGVTVISQHEIHAAPGTQFPPSPFELGAIDRQVFPFVPIDVVFIYHLPPSFTHPLDTFLAPETLRASLPHLLASYPHITGRFEQSPHKVFQIGHLGKGISFQEAKCDLRLEDIATHQSNGRILVENLPGGGNDLMTPFDATIEGVCQDPIMMVRHTRFACGGVALGIRVHHMVCDAAGFFQLVRDWVILHHKYLEQQNEEQGAKINSAPLKLDTPPVIRSYLLGDPLSDEEKREALRHPPEYFYIDDSAPDKPSLTKNIRNESEPPGEDTKPSTIVGHTLHFPRPALLSLKSRATLPDNGSWVSTFEALSAHLTQKVYQARVRALQNSNNLPSPSEAAQLLRQGFWASIDVRDSNRLNLGPRYFANASLALLTTLSHSSLYAGPLPEIAAALHTLIRSRTSSPITLQQECAWFAAVPSHQRANVKVAFEFGAGNFTVTQWSRHNMYSGVDFEHGVGPILVAPPLTEISRVDGLAFVLGVPDERGEGLDVRLTVREGVWAELVRDGEFVGYVGV